ncbi:MAG: septum formation protein Maf [Alphaproteobacteria bacterium]|nr:septum formation protein Maf [Alphaproteobacteria bacterium]
MPQLILASASPRRLQLLAQIGIVPDAVAAANINESPRKGELPHLHALRLAEEKTRAVAAQHPGAVVLGADTVVACGRRILPKAEDEQTARKCLTLLSGRRHHVYTAIAVVNAAGEMHSRIVDTSVRFARLDTREIDAYLASGEWNGKAGGYAIQGLAAAFIPWINGSYSSVVGLPLHETRQMLRAAGFLLS